MGKTDNSDAQLVKDPEQIQVGPNRLDPFDCDQQSNLPLLSGVSNFRIGFADNEAIGLIAFDIKPANLTEPNRQSAIW